MKISRNFLGEGGAKKTSVRGKDEYFLELHNVVESSLINVRECDLVFQGQKLVILKDHKHYIQGVCWDPLGQFVVTNSSDR